MGTAPYKLRQGVLYDPARRFEDQLILAKADSTATRLEAFIFHAIRLRISVQASWFTHCSYDDDGVVSFYPTWNGAFMVSSERPPFPLHKALSFEVAIHKLDDVPQLNEKFKTEFLKPDVLQTSIGPDLLSSLQKHWGKNDEIGSEVDKALVVRLLTDLALAEQTEAAELLQRAQARTAQIKEELMKVVWHPVRAHTFEYLLPSEY